jgi:hypothetical protein
MKKILRVLLFVWLSALIAAPVVAGSDDALVAVRASFQKFAKTKVQHLNRNHQNSRSRMQIKKQKNGLYCARFHKIDDSSLKFKVRRSKSKTIPYVGILSYQEKVFEALGTSPEACKRGEFAAVAVTPNKHIFSFKKGAWN